jgi:hypothetical protein
MNENSIFRRAINYLLGKPKNDNSEQITSEFHPDIEGYYKNENTDGVCIFYKDGETIQFELKAYDLNFILLKSKAQVKSLLFGESQHMTQESIKVVNDHIFYLENHPDFTILNNNVYFKNIMSIPIPKEIVACIIETLDNSPEKYESLRLFTLKLLTSPREDSRENVLTFMRDNDIRISPKGNIIAYRRVKKWEKDVQLKNANKVLYNFVQDSYEKVKKWKKSPKNFKVVSLNNVPKLVNLDFDVTNTDYICLGHLDILKNNIIKKQEDVEQWFSSTHDYGKYIFKIGDIYAIQEDEIDTNNGNCASGGLICSPSIK